MTATSRAGWERSCRKSILQFTWSAVIFVISYLGAMKASAAVDLVLNGTDSPDPVVTLSNLTYTLTLTNIGSTTATNVAITNVLSSRVTFVSATTTRGACTNVSGVVRCDWANVNAGSGGRVTIIARPSGAGLITNITTCAASQADADLSNNTLTLATAVVNRRIFGNSDFIQLDDVTPNAALPYPSRITVSGLTSAVYKITCTLSNISHAAPDDLDILLVGPNGGFVMLFSDGPITPGMTDVTVTFDDAAAQYVPDTNAVATGTYKPANYGSLADVLPPPAPNVEHLPGFTPLSVFNGINPNGDWRLFVYDDESEVGGWIDGWSLTISTMEPMANLAVTLTDSPDPALPGGTVTYTARITNMGPVNATAVRLTNQVPSGMELLSYAVSGGSCTNQSGIVRCDIAGLTVGASEQFTMQVRPTHGGNYTNRVDVTADQYDPQLANNVAVQSTFVEARVDVGVDVTSSRTPALLEQPLIYTLAVTNLGPDPASGVRVVDQLPPGVLLVNFTASQGSCTNQSGVVTCNLGSLASQGRATMFLTCRPTVLGPITNLVSVTSDQVDANTSNNAAQNVNTVDPAADLLLTITDAPHPVALTQPLAFLISVTNRGPNVASNIVVSDVLPSALRLLSLQTTRGACTNDGNSVTCAISDLPPGERVVMTVTVTPISVGTIGNSASVTSQPADPNPVNNSGTANALVLPASDISLTKVGDRALMWEGDRVTYSLVVSNAGPSTATGTRLTDTLPPGMSFNSATASAGSCSFQGGLVACTFGDLAIGGSVTVSITGTAGTSGVITNTANAFANEQDLNPGNNAAVAVTTVIPRTLSRTDLTPVIIPDVGLASVYPLTLNVSGMTAAVQRVRVTLGGFNHTYPDDLDVLLVGPGGQAVVLMSDAGGGTAVSNVNLTLDDLAPAALPDSSALSASAYRPADYDVTSNEFLAPAPPGPYGSNFDVFTGTDPNGTWKLYVIDDQTKDEGTFATGWRLDIWARDPLADLVISSQVEPTLVAVGSNVTFRVAVSNNGPATASAVLLTNAYAAGLGFVAAIPSQGSCTNEAGLLQCALGDITPGSFALVDLSFVVLGHGTISNSVGVTAPCVDLVKSNNTSTVSLIAANPPVILSQPRDRYLPLGSTATFTVIAEGEAPLSYNWFFNNNAIPDATNSILSVNDVQPEQFGEYRVQVSNRVAAVLSWVAHLGSVRPPALELIPDQLMNEDEVLTIPLTLSDLDAAFQLSAVCGDTNLIPTTNLTFTATGTNYALLIRPGTNQFGTNTITVTAMNSPEFVASRTFVLGVQSVNDYPQFVLPVGDQIMLEDGILNVPFTVGDAETDADHLIFGARAYNPALTLGIGIYGSGSNRIFTVQGLGHTFGTTTMEIRLRDEAGVRTTNLFTLTILPINRPPTISNVDDVTIPEDSDLRVSFQVADEETAPGNLLLSATSSNPGLFRDDSFAFTGTGVLRILDARPLSNAHGFAQIHVLVRDEAGLVASNAFWVTVNPVNDAPTMSAIPTIEASKDQRSAAVAFIIGDAESDPAELTLTAISTNTVLAPLAGIEFGGSGSNRTISVTPGSGQFGWMVLRVQLADPEGAVTNQEFELFVHPTNGPPVILQQPARLSVTAGTPVAFRVIATGPGALTYQWQREGLDLPGETNATLAIASAAAGNRGEYRVFVSNSEGTTPSTPAQLNVLEGTRILTLQRAGSTVELTFATIAKQRYFVEFQDSLRTNWTALPQVLGTGGIMTAVDPTPAVSSRFYRVRIE